MKKNDGKSALAEKLRRQLLNNQRSIIVNDFGSGKNRNNNRKISDIASKSLSNEKFSKLYKRIIERYDCKNILELGTSLGINTLYLAAKENASVTTFEGSTEISNLAELTFQFADSKNITLIKGDIDITLPSFINSSPIKTDFVFMDANHTYKATINYFEILLHKLHDRSIVVMDDIHYSQEMEKAWNELKRHDLVYASADLYRCGILFFDPSLNKQHVILQF